MAQNKTTIRGRKRGQRRTALSKKRFLFQFENNFCILPISVENAQIARSTLYRWRKEDEDFKEEMDFIGKHLPEIMEDKLKSAVASGNGAMVRWFLTKRHPKFMDKPPCPYHPGMSISEKQQAMINNFNP
jgi:hypothetical protein